MDGLTRTATGSARYPGFNEHPNCQRAHIRCAEAAIFHIEAGDLLSLTNIDGGCIAHLCPLDKHGEPAFAAIGLQMGKQRPGIPAGFDDRALRAFISGQGSDPEVLIFGKVFDTATKPGEIFILRARDACTLWVALAVQPDLISHGGGGSLLLEITRATRQSTWLPDPLADLRDEFRVNRSTATAYEVRKGEIIQIIDVDGQQCSDFMAMRSDALERGQERCIDSTVTRSLVGGAYPGPGLFDKFFDQDMKPLLSVVQDTVGRHDTFALACTARGYEERGFPGHINCSDNISNAFDPYGVARRSAWPAINFFFNSWILPTDNRIGIDEAWSRPGDYVALRAMDDLVCVSTACPDDVDPINGWNPTDIHVRIYKPTNTIQRAVAYRPLPESQAIMTGESAFHPRTSALTNSFAIARDVWLPTRYDATAAIEEYWACREAVTIQDMSSLRKFDVVGPDAEKLLQLCLTRNIAKLSVNRGVYALMLTQTGSVLDDGTLFRLGHDLFRWCCGSDESGHQLRKVAESEGLKVWIKALWSAMPNLAIQGPKSRDLLRRIIFTQPVHPALDNIKWFGCTIARLKDRDGPAFLLTRSGFTGELGYEIFCDRNDAVEIWDAIMEAGADLGIRPMGNEALSIIRIEAGLMVAGAEFIPDVDACEAGLGFAVDMKKPAFIGRAALDRNAQAQRRKLVGLRFHGNEHASHGDGIFLGRQQVGSITSATRSPSLECAIALARIAVEHCAEGSELEVGRLDNHMKRLPVTVCPFPFIDPARERARA